MSETGCIPLVYPLVQETKICACCGGDDVELISQIFPLPERPSLHLIATSLPKRFHHKYYSKMLSIDCHWQLLHKSSDEESFYGAELAGFIFRTKTSVIGYQTEAKSH